MEARQRWPLRSSEPSPAESVDSRSMLRSTVESTRSLAGLRSCPASIVRSIPTERSPPLSAPAVPDLPAAPTSPGSPCSHRRPGALASGSESERPPEREDQDGAQRPWWIGQDLTPRRPDRAADPGWSRDGTIRLPLRGDAGDRHELRAAEARRRGALRSTEDAVKLWRRPSPDQLQRAAGLARDGPIPLRAQRSAGRSLRCPDAGDRRSSRGCSPRPVDC